MSSKPTLGYFNVHGLAQPIRYLLVIAEVDFNDKRYPFGEGTTLADMDSVKKHWQADKESLGLDFPNVPYWIDGDVKVCIFDNYHEFIIYCLYSH